MGAGTNDYNGNGGSNDDSLKLATDDQRSIADKSIKRKRKATIRIS